MITALLIDSVGTEWWNQRLERPHQRVWTHAHEGYRLPTRGDLFRLGRAATTKDATDDAVLTLLRSTLP